MKIPHLMTPQQATHLAVAALFFAVFLRLFGGLAVALLVAVAFLAAAYVVIAKFAPDYIAPPKGE